MFSASTTSLYFSELLGNTSTREKKKALKLYAAIIKRDLFMVFSSHQSLLPVTSAVKSAVMLW